MNGVGLLRRTLVIALMLIALGGLAGCSLPGTSVPTATPSPTATSIPATATAVPVAIATPSARPAAPTATATATVTARPSAPVTPSVLLGIPATPATPGSPAATPATPIVGTFVLIQDARQACELTLPGEFVPTPTPGSFASADGRVMVALQSFAAGPDDTLDDLALPFVGAFIPTVEGYEQTAVNRQADSLRIDFTGNLSGRGTGTLYFHQFGSTVCVVTLFVADGTAIDYDAFFESLIATLKPKGVG